MSMNATDLTCDKCDFTGRDSVVWGDFRYLEDDVEIVIHRTLGWCQGCDGFAPIEVFGDRDEVVAGLNLAIDNNEILARNNGVKSDLYLNKDGGFVHMAGAKIIGGADLVEGFDTGEEQCEPGTVIVIDPDRSRSRFRARTVPRPCRSPRPGRRLR